MGNIKVVIDNGHGADTPGKCSPDKRLREYAYCREIARRVSGDLSLRGYETLLLVPETNDTPLNERVGRVNGRARELGAKNVVLVSIHNNAAGDGSDWFSARGFSVFVSNNASINSKALARIFTDNATAMKLMGNRCVPAEKYWEDSLAITRDTICPAVLTENLFMDNEEDLAYLLSEEGKRAIVELHVKSIIQYIQSLS